MSEPRPNSNAGSAASSGGTSRGLIEAARVHDPAAWERMVTLYAPLVLFWCRQWGLREEDAADVFQDVFQSVAAHIAGFTRGTGGTFRGWLRTITRNKVNDAFRRQRREPAGVGGSERRPTSRSPSRSRPRTAPATRRYRRCSGAAWS